MNSKRLFALALTTLALAALASFIVLLRPGQPRPGITLANARRIRTGMPLKQVEAIMGGPASILEHPPSGKVLAQWWQSDDCRVFVTFKPGPTVDRVDVEQIHLSRRTTIYTYPGTFMSGARATFTPAPPTSP